MSFQIIRGRVKKPFNVVLIGVPGIGKTSWAVGYEDEQGVWHEGAPKPIVIGPEENDEIQADRFAQPGSFDEFNAQLTDLIANPRGYQTCVIDTLDAVEKLLHKKILGMDSKQSGSMMAALGGYGKAYERAESELMHTRSLLKQLRDKHGMNIILIAHTKKARATDTVLGLEYDTYEMNLHAKAQALFVDWVSCVLFANYVARPQEGANSDKIFAMGHGERVLLTARRPGHLGKNRYNLPYKLPLEFTDFYAGYEAFYAGKLPEPAQLIDAILGLLSNIQDEDFKKKVMLSVEDNKDNAKFLQKCIDRLNELVGTAPTKDEEKA
jgi:hypothetical protein